MARHPSVTKVHDTSLSSPNRDDFAAMLEESFITQSPAEGSVIKGKIVAIENDFAVIDVGLKTEGRISLKEFAMPGLTPKVEVGDEVEVYLERVENALGEAVRPFKIVCGDTLALTPHGHLLLTEAEEAPALPEAPAMFATLAAVVIDEVHHAETQRFDFLLDQPQPIRRRRGFGNGYGVAHMA